MGAHLSIETTVRPRVAVRHRTDRLVYVLTALLCVVAVIVGFYPRSAAILSGNAPSPPTIIHVHAALMVAWLLLFVTQTVLIAASRRHWHRVLGLTSFAIAPAMVATMIAAAMTSFAGATRAGAGHLASNILLAQIKDLVLFSLFYAWAVYTRRTGPETHKRMMVMATLVLMDAATGRVEWLPGNFPSNSYALAPVYHLALFVPVLLNDVIRSGRPHKACVIGLGLVVLFMLATRILWSDPWWLRTAPRLMGMNH